MADGPRGALRSLIGRKQVLAIVGAGASIGTTGGAPVASWIGLLKHGVDYCREWAHKDQDWGEIVRRELARQDGESLLSAATKIETTLKAPDGGLFRKWLRASIGALEVVDRGVLSALHALGVPLATTNYDGLIEQVTGLPPVTWKQTNEVERVLRGEEPGVLHLHGYWKESDTVVLGCRSYEEVVRDRRAQSMLRNLLGTRTVLFVGCGAGLADPNFGKLLSWASEAFAGSEYPHFRLALEGELAELLKEHPVNGPVQVLSFGEKHGDLGPFLRGLAPDLSLIVSSSRATGVSGATGSSANPCADAPGPAHGFSEEPVAPGSPPRSPPIGKSLSAPASPSPAEAGSTAPTHSFPPLPAKPTCFGRDEEVKDLVRTLLQKTPPPTPVVGGPGIGKTTVTLAALHNARVERRYNRRRIFVRCDSARTRDEAVALVANAAGVPLGPDREPRLLAELANGPAVLVLDNLETPWEHDPAPTEELLGRLAAIDGLALVASIRGQDWPAGTWRDPIAIEPLTPAAARAAFLAVAGRKKFQADPRLDDLLAAVDCVPLAVVLLAHYARPEPDLTAVWQQWDAHRTDLLHRLGGDDRLLSFAVSVETSLVGRRMTDDARRLLRLLGVLPDGIARTDLNAVLPEAGVRAAHTLRAVGLAYDEAERLRVLAPIRAYVHDHHPPTPDDLDPAIVHYARLAEIEGPKVGREEGEEATRRLAAEMANLDVMILAGLKLPVPRPAIDAARGLGQFVWMSGLGTPIVLERARAVAHASSDHSAAARCNEMLGDIALARSDHDAARARYEEALPLYTRVGSVLGQANCIKSLGDIALRRSDHDAARAKIEEALPLYVRVGDALGQANCIRSLGDIALRRSDHDAARARIEEALPLYVRVGDFRGQANCIQSLGNIALERSDHDAARAKLEEALPLYVRVGDVLGQANCIKGLGDIARERSEHDAARARYEEALPLYLRVGAVLGQANCIQSLGDIALARSDHDAARARYEEALPLYLRVGAVLGQANCIKSLGDIARERSDHDAARARYEEALPLFLRVGSVQGQANCILGLGDIARERSDHDAARAKFEEALALYRRIEEPYSIGWAHVRLARIAPDADARVRHARAAREAWRRIGREDLVEKHLGEFGDLN